MQSSTVLRWALLLAGFFLRRITSTKCDSKKDHKAVDILAYKDVDGKRKVVVGSNKANLFGSSYIRCPKEVQTGEKTGHDGVTHIMTGFRCVEPAECEPLQDLEYNQVCIAEGICRLTVDVAKKEALRKMYKDEDVDVILGKLEQVSTGDVLLHWTSSLDKTGGITNTQVFLLDVTDGEPAFDEDKAKAVCGEKGCVDLECNAAMKEDADNQANLQYDKVKLYVNAELLFGSSEIIKHFGCPAASSSNHTAVIVILILLVLLGGVGGALIYFKGAAPSSSARDVGGNEKNIELVSKGGGPPRYSGAQA